MFLSEILELVRAGYSKEEIDAMTEAPAANIAASPAEPAPIKADPETPAATAAAATGAAVDPSAALAAVLADIKTTLAAMQAQAVKSDSRPGQPKETAGQMIAKAIAETGKKE